jgi:hypothetical protein
MNMLRKVLLVVLTVAMTVNVGCASVPAFGSGGGSELTAHADCDGHDPAEAEHVHRRARKYALYPLVGALVVTVAIVDLMLLPFTYRDPFPCCRGVLRLCR